MYQETTCTEELLDQYIETLKDTNEKLEELQSELNQGNTTDDKLNYDIDVVRSWKSNLEYAIAWMKTGHNPEFSRAIERRAAYQNEKPIDPLLMQRYFRSTENYYAWDNASKEHVITPSERILLDKVMDALTEKELEVYMMARGNCFSQYKTAQLMGVSRSSVKTWLSRANKKIARILAAMEGEA